MISRAEDYRFVVPDDDAMQNGAHPFTGEIMPNRSNKSILKYEDICFLQEACGELTAVLAFFGGNLVANSSFPFGSWTSSGQKQILKVPRILYGAAVGRFGPGLVDGRTDGRLLNPVLGVGRYFNNHTPNGDAGCPHLFAFISAVGSDAEKLLSYGMTIDPVGGYALNDLAGYAVSPSLVGMGYGLKPPGTGLFDVFYTLVTYASSLYALQAAAEPGRPTGSRPLSFGGYVVGKYAEYAVLLPAYLNYVRYYEDLSFHGGYVLKGDLVSHDVRIGMAPAVYVNPSVSLPTSTAAVMERTKTDLNGDVTVKSGTESYTSSELAADAEDNPTTIHVAETKNSKLFYAMMDSALGGGIGRYATPVPTLNRDVSSLAKSNVVSPGLVSASFALPALCRRVFVLHFSPEYVETINTFNVLEGRRSTYYESSNGGSYVVSGDTGAQTPSQTGVVSFPEGVHFRKVMEGTLIREWTADESADPPEQYVESSSSTTCRRDVDEYTQRTDSLSVSVNGSYSESSANLMTTALVPGAGGGASILAEVHGTVMATVTHVLRKWGSSSWGAVTPEYSAESKTYPLRYTLTNPTNVNGVIEWSTSATATSLVNQALSLFEASASDVFPTAAVTQQSVPGNIDQDPRLPAIPVGMPSAYDPAYGPSISATVGFSESLSVSFTSASVDMDDCWEYGGVTDHFAFAEVNPRTAT